MNEQLVAVPDRAKQLAAEVLSTSRRRVVCGAFGLSAAALLAACSSPTPEPDSQKTESKEPTDDSQAGGAEPLAKVADIPVGGGLAAAGMVLVQPEEGTIVAFEGACPHKGTQLPAPEGDTITCPSHGSQFNAADGALVNGPATSGLTEVPVTVTDGEVFKA